MNISLHLSDKESSVLDELCFSTDLNKQQLLRQALRLYQHVHVKIATGHTMAFVDESGNVVQQVIIGLEGDA